jgi:hypothetical protein
MIKEYIVGEDVICTLIASADFFFDLAFLVSIFLNIELPRSNGHIEQVCNSYPSCVVIQKI